MLHYYAGFGFIAANSLSSWMEYLSDGKYEGLEKAGILKYYHMSLKRLQSSTY